MVASALRMKLVSMQRRMCMEGFLGVLSHVISLKAVHGGELDNKSF